MGLAVHQVDAFTDRPFAGNPAAVCVLDVAREDVWMQAVAAEMNLSETAFLVRRGEGAAGGEAGGGGFDLRWFTPTTEVDLCGHATLASAHRLWETGELAAGEEGRFHTRSGLLTARRGAGGWIEMDFPALPPRPLERPPELLAAALGVPALWVGKSRDDLLVLVDSAATVRALAPAIDRVARLPARGLIVTAAADPGSGHDFVSRFFAPAVGVPEDPVTGSAHCCLGPFWAERLGKEVVVGYQASARGGTVRVEPRGERVILAGQAVTVMVGELVGPAAE
jgi:PhzF family phenazine biosynthesis protein